MLNIKNVEKRFGAQVVLDSIDCQIAPKERVIILGQNGAGKTTLLRCILEELRKIIFAQRNRKGKFIFKDVAFLFLDQSTNGADKNKNRQD
ncbi:ATP-binding cassette domain-containing protein [Burkholderiales bacterium]|nr:ATP-binding cassette domain-containing protein [Burkholderiales bacterium]